MPVQEAADKGSLATCAARSLNAGILAAGVVHLRVLLPLLAGALAWVAVGTGAMCCDFSDPPARPPSHPPCTPGLHA